MGVKPSLDGAIEKRGDMDMDMYMYICRHPSTCALFLSVHAQEMLRTNVGRSLQQLQVDLENKVISFAQFVLIKAKLEADDGACVLSLLR